MGLFRRKIDNPVMGTARIVSCSSPGNPKAIRSTCVLFVVVEGPGLEPASHELRKQVRVARWPSPGMTLPCRIDPRKPDRIEVDFDAIPDWQDQARANAAAQAAAMAAGAGVASDGAGSPMSGPVTVIGAGSAEEAEAGVRKAEQVLGMDLDGDGKIG